MSLLIFVYLFGLALPILTLKNASHRSTEDPMCASHLSTLNQYPAIITRSEIVGTDPIKIKVSFRSSISNKREYTFEGLLLGAHITTDIALTTCRSIGCSKVVTRGGKRLARTHMCEFTCPDGTSTKQNCLFILGVDDLKCQFDAMNLHECIQNPLWRFWGYSPRDYDASHVMCAGCEPDWWLMITYLKLLEISTSNKALFSNSSSAWTEKEILS
jgi:hypothetical protein